MPPPRFDQTPKEIYLRVNGGILVKLRRLYHLNIEQAELKRLEGEFAVKCLNKGDAMHCNLPLTSS